MIKLGQKAKDIITGFNGVVVGRAEYLTGCTQVLLVPQGLTKEGKRRDGEWFDEQRLKVDGKDTLVLQNDKTPGPDRPAPKY